MEAVPSDSPEPTPFERFRDLTRKLIQVPKEELDARLAEKRTKKAALVVEGNATPKGV